MIEDLHWADDNMLDFVDELVEWVTDVPLLVVGTARPELLTRRPGWGGGKLNATTVALSPLTDEQTATLIGGLLARPVLADAQQKLLEQSGGNPLYAEQFAELYVERGSADELPLPETLQGIIAARLDRLGSDEKDLVLDAAVVGKVFWTGSLGREDDPAATFLSLERKGFVRRQRRSSVEGEAELAFAHALVRDVAYGQIPRADRAAKHRRVAEWIESLGRPEDHAEMRAYHWRSALDLARAGGWETADLVERARLSLRDAGDRAFALNSFAVAAAQYEDALALWPEDAERPDLLFRYGRALHHAYDERRAEALEAARSALLAAGNTDLAAEAESYLGLIAWYEGDQEAARDHLTRAADLAADSVSPSAARVLAVSARTRAIADELDDAARLAASALALAERLQLDELRAHALTTIGMVKNSRGDPSGTADIERALEIALEIDSPVAATILNNLAVEAVFTGDMRRAATLYREGVRVAERLGNSESARFTMTNVIYTDYFSGRWDDALQALDEFIAACEAGAPHANEPPMRALRGSIRRARGDQDGALADHRRAVELGRKVDDAHGLGDALAACAATLADRGELTEARRLVDETITCIRRSSSGFVGGVGELLPYIDRLDVTRALVEAFDANPPPRDIFWRDVVHQALTGDAVGAADVVANTGHRVLEAYLRILAGMRHLAAGRRDEGESELRSALAFYRQVGATHAMATIEEHLATAQSESA